MAQRPSLIPVDPADVDLGVYVPARGTPADAVIRDHSAVVSDGVDHEGRLRCFYQDYGPGGPANEQMRRFADRVHHAAGAMLINYPQGAPTIAVGWFPSEMFVRVGAYDYKRGVVSLNGPQAEAALADWIEQVALAPEELETQQVLKHEQRRSLEKMLATGDPVERERARIFARAMHVDPSEIGL